ncbi:hypothetical protein [Amorphus sp. MBR-141]
MVGIHRLGKFAGRSRTEAAKALTFTAQDAQAALVAQAGQIFVLRNSWIQKGIRIRPAKAATLEAQVGTIDKYMARHVKGQDKSPDSPLSVRGSRDSRGRQASGGLLLKGYGSIGSVPKHTVVRRQIRRLESNKRKPFHIVDGGKVLIVSRVGKKRYPLKIHAMLIRHANMDRIWNFVGTVRRVVRSRFPGHLRRALERASRTS